MMALQSRVGIATTWLAVTTAVALQSRVGAATTWLAVTTTVVALQSQTCCASAHGWSEFQPQEQDFVSNIQVTPELYLLP
jgi:hypothetical protein